MIFRKKIVAIIIFATLLLSIPAYADNSGYKVMDAKVLNEVDVESVSEGMVKFYNDQWLYGYMNEAAEVVIAPQFDDAKDFHSGVAQVSKDGDIIYIDTKGKELFKLSTLEDQFEDYIDVYDFNDGLALVEIGYSDVAYINTKGQFVFPKGQYDYGTSFSDGVAYVSNPDGEYFAIDTLGNRLFNLNDDWDYYDFEDNRALVYDYDTDQYSYIDKTGKLIMDFKLDDAFDFVGEYAVYEEVGKYGLIDQKGNFVLHPTYNNLVVFESGSAIGYDGAFSTLLNSDFKPTMRIYGDLIDGYDSNSKVYNRVIIDQNSGAYRVRDFAGNVLGEYDEVWSLGSDLFATASGELINTKAVSVDLKGDDQLDLVGQYVYDVIDTKGDVVLSLNQYDSVQPFSEGLALVEKNGKFGYINSKGDVVIPIKYTGAEPFVDGKATVYTDYVEYVIDLKGKVIETRDDDDYYSYDEETDENYYTISVDSYGPMGLADKQTNKIVLEPIYEDVDYLGNGIYELMNDDYLYGFYDTKTKKLIEPQYEDYEINAENGLIVVNDENYDYGLIDMNGKVILETVYDYITFENNALINVQAGEVYGLFDLKGKEVVAAKYDMVNYFDTVDGLDIYGLVLDDTEYIMTYDKTSSRINKIMEIDYKGDFFELVNNKYIAYSNSAGETVFQDLNGKVYLKAKDEVVDWSGDYVQCINARGEYYLLDYDGKTYLKGNDFEDFYLPVENDHIIYTDGVGYGIATLDGLVKTDQLYSNVSYIKSGIMTYYHDYAFGYVNLDGEDLIKPGKYSYLYNFSDGLGLGIREQ